MNAHSKQESLPLFVRSERRDRILELAGSLRLPVSLTRNGPDGWIEYRSSLVKCDRDRQAITVESPRGVGDAPAPRMKPGERVGVAFRRGRSKCMFHSIVTADEMAQDSGESLTVIDWPLNLQELQRRLFMRVAPPPGTTLDVAYWPSESDAEHTHRGVLKDLSAGGMGLLTSEPLEFQPSQSLNITVTGKPGEDPIRLDARIKHVQAAAAGSQRMLGLQFVGLETSDEGHVRLAKLASWVTAFRRGQVLADRRRLQTRLGGR